MMLNGQKMKEQTIWQFNTIMQPADYREHNIILCVAQAERITPLGMLQNFNT